ncbi:neurogenic locus notch homolog protein 1-like [Corticium candelabrum]|uniref:neurogenic locus notch homolog protein 1-like n=1 Tax=Corticium candelabrum TaxID=121492 RepID=UPI002E26D234|nr:neurogenic locus notch homolog protein 1-like [Corticium candelabrum]
MTRALSCAPLVALVGVLVWPLCCYSRHLADLPVDPFVHVADTECGKEKTRCVTSAASAQFGCCAMRNATCCTDGIHCCPRGFDCGMKNGFVKCFPGASGLFPVLPVNSVNCLGGGTCPDGETCCSLGKNGEGCCPLENAVCCSDRQHCCPSGYTCDDDNGLCLNSNEIEMRYVRVRSDDVSVRDVTCPDGDTCEDGNTCCSLGTGDYGCCPLPNAVCCSDHLHCCPSGTTCDTTSNTCLESPIKFIDIKSSDISVTDVTCPDGDTCEDGNTCCSLGTGDYGCCPLPNAVCCSDHLHCCPSGTTCDTTSNTCLESPIKFIDIKSSDISVTVVTCPDGDTCEDGNTCCSLGTGDYGCCPLPNAVCCSDHLHCCPSGTTCDTTSNTCLESPIKFIDIKSSDVSVTVVTCPDGDTCEDGNTCCSLGTGDYGCCPLPNAVCCSDHLHCCPSGTTCDTTSNTCLESPIKFIDIKSSDISVTVVTCPDGDTCEDGNTCCSLGTGDYGCCPLPNAVCCSDHLHCCPSGTTCDTTSNTCLESPIKFIDIKSSDISVTVVTCPDGDTCEDGNTCCSLGTGDYGCCPLPNAVCCSDHLHCCPNGTTCDTTSNTCLESGIKFIDIKSSDVSVTVVTCPDGGTCEDGNTCCSLGTGDYGCCPLPNAVCCSDHLHCCPSGTTCDTTSNTCLESGIKFIDIKSSDVSVTVVTCPDGDTCEDGNTCCSLGTGDYGCCPLPNAVCCSDHLHCCPNGTTCDTTSNTCLESGIKFIDIKSSDVSVTVVTCPDGGTCEDGNTCCSLGTGDYGCCPLPNAVCCSDHLHCCPSGTTCDTTSNTCLESGIKFIDIKSSDVSVTDVPCPDGDTCEDGNTCCSLGNGDYGCCPLPNAVCCSDHVHCCPEGYTCEVSTGECLRSVTSDAQLVQVKSTDVSVKDVTCQDGSECSDGQTCCSVGDSRYGCCPYPNAVCCSDHEYCCPSGSTCLSGGYCASGSVRALEDTRLHGSKIGLKAGISCPNGIVCKRSQSCCSVGNDMYGCCPYPSAACCSDGKHCCPSGYTCDLTRHGSGICQRVLTTSVALQAVRSTTSVYCPDGEFCAQGSTCCQEADKKYGCCPLANAVCCSDRLHCCPQGYKCDSSGMCVKTSEVVVLAGSHASTPSYCPDGSVCPANYGCCPHAKSEHYRCCSYGQSAVCCSDGRHCCPARHTCDIKNNICTPNDEVFAAVALQVIDTHTTTCPDGRKCPAGVTCCPTNGLGRSYGCCGDGAHATCCSDYVHCCPHGFKCDLSNGVCRPPNALEMEKSLIVLQPRLKYDEDCSHNGTYCVMSDGRYGCCEGGHDAICCPDRMHCCPRGHRCVGHGLCARVGDVVQMAETVASRSVDARVIDDVVKFEDADEL